MWDEEVDERAWYDTDQVCMNGHVINHMFVDAPEHNKDYCPECGEPTITTCPHCQKDIPGYFHNPKVFYTDHNPAPAFCQSCGKPYPWTVAKVHAAKELASELEGLTPDEVETLKKSIDEISKNNPQATVGATRFKKIMLKVGSGAGDVLKDVIKDVASETAKKVLLGQ